MKTKTKPYFSAVVFYLAREKGEEMKERILFLILLLAISVIPMAFALSEDLNEDKIVNIDDVAVVAKSFGSALGHPRWNAKADLWPVGIGDGKIDLHDVWQVAEQFGKTTV